MRRLRFSTSTASPAIQQEAPSTAPVVRPARLKPPHAPRHCVQMMEQVVRAMQQGQQAWEQGKTDALALQ